MVNDVDPKLFMLFAKIVECRGISPAARLLSLPKATLSRGMSKLEAALGTRLVERSARSFRLTEAGATIYRHGQRIAEEVEEARAAAGSLQTVMRGQLRIAAPLTFGRSLLAPVLPGFLMRHPELRVEVELTTRRVDPVEENFDLVIRLGPLADTSLVARPLCAIRFALCASPGYLRARAILRHPDELARHAVIDAFDSAERHNWVFMRGEERAEVGVVPRFDANDPIIRREAAVAGLGVALLPQWLIRDEVERRKLELVLPQWRSSRDSEIYALFPNRRSLSAKSRALLTFLEDEIPARLAGGRR